MSNSGDSIVQKLFEVLEDRKNNPREKSYTNQLLSGGVEKIGKKITEESAEVIEAAGEPGEKGRAHLVYEAADLVYHLGVMLVHREIAWQEIEAELARRFGISGIDEKESRNQKKE